MPDDEMTQAMMQGYERASNRFLDSEDEVKRFLGSTGLMLSRCVSQLWTQQELEQEIDKRVTTRCANCANTQWIEMVKRGEACIPVSRQLEQTATPENVKPGRFIMRFAAENGRHIVWGVVVIIVAATFCGKLESLGDFYAQIRGVNRQISAHNGPDQGEG